MSNCIEELNKVYTWRCIENAFNYMEGWDGSLFKYALDMGMTAKLYALYSLAQSMLML